MSQRSLQAKVDQIDLRVKNMCERQAFQDSKVDYISEDVAAIKMEMSKLNSAINEISRHTGKGANYQLLVVFGVVFVGLLQGVEKLSTIDVTNLAQLLKLMGGI